jgi:hypothetical protein
MNHIMQKITRLLLVLACVLVLQPKALGSFDQGTVGVSVGRQSISLEQGETGNVSVTFSPASSSQLPGCGMAECPQSCGEKECLDANGQCTCNGTTYQTYSAYATVSSSNTSVATASYGGSGVVSISALSPGTATITVTASLRQFTSTSTTITVTVTAVEQTPTPTATATATPVPTAQPTTPTATATPTAKPTATTKPTATAKPTATTTPAATAKPTTSTAPTTTTTPITSSTPTAAATATATPSTTTTAPATTTTTPAATAPAAEPSPSPSAGDLVIATPVDTAEPEEEAEPETAQEPYTSIDSDRGTIYFVPITQGKMGKEVLELILGQEVYADFQKKDDAENILYAWEFYGMDLTAAEDLIFTADISTTPFSGCDYGTAGDSVYVSFTDAGALPGPATFYLRVSDYLAADTLNVYAYEDGAVQPISLGAAVENGYLSVTLDTRQSLILTTQTLESAPEITEAALEEEETVSAISALESAEPEETEDAENENHLSPVMWLLIMVAALLLGGAVVEIVYSNLNHKDKPDA